MCWKKNFNPPLKVRRSTEGVLVIFHVINLRYVKNNKTPEMNSWTLMCDSGSNLPLSCETPDVLQVLEAVRSHREDQNILMNQQQ